MNQHTPELIAQANLWRSMYNPLRGLTMMRIASLLEEGEQGRYQDVTWLYRFILKRNAVLRAGRRKRAGALAKMGWDIRMVAEDKLQPGQKALAEKQAATLRMFYEGIDNVSAAIDHLETADWFGFAHLEIHRNDAGQVTHLEPVPQWHFNRKGLYGRWHYDATAAGGHTGIPLDPANWIIREVPDPIMEIGAVVHARTDLAEKDYVGFIETFGIPSIFITMPPNVPEKDQEKFQSVAESIVAASCGVLPNGAAVTTEKTGMTGTPPFLDYLKHQDERLVLAMTGGKLTMLAESGSGTLGGGAHADTFDDIAAESGAKISEKMQELDKAVLEAAYPGQPRLAYFSIQHEDRDDVDALFERNAKLAPSGLRIAVGDLAEKSGYDIEAIPPAARSAAQGAPVPARNTATPVQAAEAALARAGIAATAEALQADFKPVAEALRELLRKVEDANLDDAAVRDALAAFADTQAPKLLAQIGKDAELDKVLQAILGTELAVGIAGRKTEARE